jgi:NUMOD4 motif/HNH endonuclease
MQQLSFDDIEIWLPVVGFEGLYEVSSHGRVRSIPRRGTRAGAIRKLGRHHKHGYLDLNLRRPGAGTSRHLVHVLVAEAFLGARPRGQVVRHLNDDPADNNAWNLAWGTQGDNGRDATANGRNHYANRTRCNYGHKFTPANTGHTKGGARYCRRCLRDRSRARRAQERLNRKAA